MNINTHEQEPIESIAPTATVPRGYRNLPENPQDPWINNVDTELLPKIVVASNSANRSFGRKALLGATPKRPSNYQGRHKYH